MDNKIFRWDKFSDQPHQIRDKQAKKRLKSKNRWQIAKTIFLAIFSFPIFLIYSLFPKRGREIDISKFFGIGLNLDKGYQQLDFLKELNLKSVAVRFPIWEIDKIDDYLNFIAKLENYEILLIVLQDRENIEDLELFEKNIETLFMRFGKIGVQEFQIGNTINRSKWGFFSISEYLNFFEIAFKVRDREFPNLKLVGSGVIDFEYFFTIHTLFNFKNFKYDKFSSLLYVDRRGSPEGKQYFFYNLYRKIELLFSIVSLSPKSSKSIYITEANWPIRDTAPFTPTSPFETVSPEDYSIFMVRYFLISLSTRFVEKIFWHQLVSAGYGLIDHRDENQLKPYPSFRAFQTLLNLLKNEKYSSHSFGQNLQKVDFQTISIFWTLEKNEILNFDDEVQIFSIYGEKSFSKSIEISQKPIYIKIKQK
jgi:hypothetical protein